MIMSVFNNIAKGQIGERYVCKHLRRKRYKILATNMRNKYSEIDIIAENKEYIIFVEVKSRSKTGAIAPSDAVDFPKQQKLLKAAKYYLTYTYKTNKQPRFDVAEVYLDSKHRKVDSINYIENAFGQGGTYAVF